MGKPPGPLAGRATRLALAGLGGLLLLVTAGGVWAALAAQDPGHGALMLVSILTSAALGTLLLGAFSTVVLHGRRRAEALAAAGRAAAEPAPVEGAALIDEVTGLRNRRGFDEDLGRELQRRNRLEHPLTLVLMDLDGFRRLTEERGAGVGAEELRAVAGCLDGAMRGADSLYRLDEDEFAAILAGETAWGGFRLVQRLQRNLHASPATQLPSVTAGVVEATAPLASQTLLGRAYVAMEHARDCRRGALIWSRELEQAGPRSAVGRSDPGPLATALARAVDAKDPYTRSHSETVSESCALIGRELGLDSSRVAKLRLAGLLHDVGKIGVADAILHKPARLSPEEFEVMKAHATLGHRIVGGADLEEVAEWILHHHERPDGRGYPHGLRSEEVPLESRIILVADAFEAITSDRPYRRGRPEDEAFAELERHAGSQFDPRCVAALREAIGSCRRSRRFRARDGQPAV